MKPNKSFLLAVFLLCSVSAMAVPHRWVAEVSRLVAEEVNGLQGETIEFYPEITAYGEPYVSDAYQLHYQTNGMGSLYFSGDITTNLPVLFTPAMDIGAASYSFFIGASNSLGLCYRPHGTIRMKKSPGFRPDTIPLPMQRIDFATTSYTNAPWLLSADLSDPLSRISELEANSNKLNTAFGWGEHAGLYRHINWEPSWSELTGKPLLFAPAPHDYTSVTNPPWLTVQTQQLYVASAGAVVGSQSSLIATALQPIDIATNQTTELWSPDKTQYIDGAGSVFGITQESYTNSPTLLVTFAPGFYVEDANENPAYPPHSSYTFPADDDVDFDDGDWNFVITRSGEKSYSYFILTYTPRNYTLVNTNSGALPLYAMRPPNDWDWVKLDYPTHIVTNTLPRVAFVSDLIPTPTNVATAGHATTSTTVTGPQSNTLAAVFGWGNHSAAGYLTSSYWLLWLGTNSYLAAGNTNGWTVSEHTFWKDSHVVVLPTNRLNISVYGPSLQLSDTYWLLTNSAAWYASTGRVAITTLDGSYLVSVNYNTFKSRDGDLFPQESTLNSFRRVSATQFVLSAWCADGGMGSYFFAISNIVAYTYDDNTVTPGSVTNDAAAIVSRVDDPEPADKRGTVNRNTMEAYLESQKALIAKSAWNYTPSGSVRPDTEVCTIDQPLMQQGLISYIQSGDCYAQSAVGDQYFLTTTGSVWRIGPSGRTMLELASTNKLLRISEFSVSGGLATLTINTNICYGIPFIEQCKNLLNQQWITDPYPSVSIVGSNYVIIVSASADAKFYRSVCVGGDHRITSYARHYAPYGLVGDLDGKATSSDAVTGGQSNTISLAITNIAVTGQASVSRSGASVEITVADQSVPGAITNNSSAVSFSNLTITGSINLNGMTLKGVLNNNGTNGIIIMQPNDANEYMIWLPPPQQ